MQTLNTRLKTAEFRKRDATPPPLRSQAGKPRWCGIVRVRDNLHISSQCHQGLTKMHISRARPDNASSTCCRHEYAGPPDPSPSASLHPGNTMYHPKLAACALRGCMHYQEQGSVRSSACSAQLGLQGSDWAFTQILNNGNHLPRILTSQSHAHPSENSSGADG